MRKLYTAIGHFCRRGRGDITYPYVNVNGQEYVLDMQEMTLWVLLNWRILSAEQLEIQYGKRSKESGLAFQRSLSDCMSRLVQRGLVMEGGGETDADALYDLLSNLYIIPLTESPFLRVLSFIRLVFKGVPVSLAKRILKRDRRDDAEKRIMRLSRQTLLSTAELIRCAELQITDLPTEESVLDALYSDEFTTSDNLSELVRYSHFRNQILASVANLYLRQQIIFERI